MGARRGGGARLEIGEEGNVAHLGAGKEVMDATVRRGGWWLRLFLTREASQQPLPTLPHSPLPPTQLTPFAQTTLSPSPLFTASSPTLPPLHPFIPLTPPSPPCATITPTLYHHTPPRHTRPCPCASVLYCTREPENCSSIVKGNIKRTRLSPSLCQLS